LLLQTLKQEEGKIIKRIKGFMIFDKLTEDVEGESKKLYGTLWKYVVLPKRMVRFNLDNRFNLSDVLGETRAKRYDGQAEIVRLEKEDELLVHDRISQFLI
jgi:hypothetical protein